MLTQTDPIKVALTIGVQSSCIADLLALQRAEEPDTPIQLYEAPFQAVIDGLGRRFYDLALMPETEVGGAFASQTLWQEDMVVGVPRRSPLLAHPVIPLDALDPYEVIGWSPSVCAPLCQHIEALLRNVVGLRRATYEASSTNLMCVLIAAGYGVGLGLRSQLTQPRDIGIVVRPLANGPHSVKIQLVQLAQSNALAIERFSKRASRAFA